jgi:hypothetical protein
MMVVSVSFTNCLENATVPDVAVAVGDDEEDPIIDVIIDVDELRMDVDEDSLMDDAADDCVDEDELLVPVDVELAASGTLRASAAQADTLNGFVPT